MNSDPKNSMLAARLPLTLRYTLGVIIVLAISLVVFYLLMNPPMAELGLMSAFLLVTALVSGLAGFWPIAWVG